MQRNEYLSSKQCIRARMRARMQESIRPPPLSFLFFWQCRGPVLGFFFLWGGGGIFLVGSRIRALAVFFFGSLGGGGPARRQRQIAKATSPPRGEGKVLHLDQKERGAEQQGTIQKQGLSCHILQVSTRASEQRRLSHYQKVVTLVYWSFCEAKCGEVSIDALLQKRGACWAVNHGARWWRANAGAGERLTIYRDPGETMRWKG